MIGTIYRLILLALDTPPHNSDEATMGIAALQIAHFRQIPLIFYGQGYMGTFEAFLSAPFVTVLGPNVWALRVPLLMLFIGLCFLMYRLCSLIFTPTIGAVTSIFLALGSDRVMKDQLIAGGGYPEIAPGTVLALLIAARLAVGSGRYQMIQCWLLGVLLGGLFWDDWLTTPYLLAIVAVLLVTARHALNLARVVGILAGTALGLLPLLLYNLSAPASLSTWQSFHNMRRSVGPQPGLWEHLNQGISIGFAMGWGACAPSSCAGWQRGASLLFILGICGSVIAIVLACARRYKHADPRATTSGHLRPDIISPVVGSVLVVSLLLLIAAYLKNPASVTSPIESARYLYIGIVSLPGVLFWLTRLRSRRPTLLLGSGILAMLFVSNMQLVRSIHDYRQMRSRQTGLIGILETKGIQHIYGDYSTCAVVSYSTDERTVCAALADSLQNGLNRIPRYLQIVSTSPDAAYVAAVGTPLDMAVASSIARNFSSGQLTTAYGYHIYQPSTHIPRPVAGPRPSGP